MSKTNELSTIKNILKIANKKNVDICKSIYHTDDKIICSDGYRYIRINDSNMDYLKEKTNAPIKESSDIYYKYVNCYFDNNIEIELPTEEVLKQYIANYTVDKTYYRYELPVTEDFSLFVNAKYLLSIMKLFKGCKAYANKQLKYYNGILIVDDKDATQFGILMPMR